MLPDTSTATRSLVSKRRTLPMLSKPVRLFGRILVSFLFEEMMLARKPAKTLRQLIFAFKDEVSISARFPGMEPQLLVLDMMPLISCTVMSSSSQSSARSRCLSLPGAPAGESSSPSPDPDFSCCFSTSLAYHSKLIPFLRPNSCGVSMRKRGCE